MPFVRGSLFGWLKISHPTSRSRYSQKFILHRGHTILALFIASARFSTLGGEQSLPTTELFLLTLFHRFCKSPCRSFGEWAFVHLCLRSEDMITRWQKGALIASVGLAAFGISSARGATVIGSNSSAVVDGWNITTAAGVSITVDSSSGNTLSLTKAANFTMPNRGLMVTFQQVGTSSISTFDITNEALTNSTGSAFSAFDFLLMNPGPGTVSFEGVANVFVPPVGPGVNYTGVSLNSAKDDLTYTGTQANNTTANFGSSAAGDQLLISAIAGTSGAFQDFTLKELPTNGGTPPPAVPLPASVWQSLAVLMGLAGFAGVKKIRKTYA
jgi:hypothetical protein